MSLHPPIGPNKFHSPNPQISKALKPLKPLSRVQQRSVETSTSLTLETPEQIAYQHSVLCQTSLPYRDPGSDTRVWDKEQGIVSLRIRAGEDKNPETGEWIQLGLPFGTKPRLILAHLNAEALRTESPKINVEDSFTAFVQRIQSYRPNGKEIRAFKDHLGRLSAATIRMAISTDGHSLRVNSQIVTAFDLWFPKDKSQRVLWPSTLHLSHEYFTSLQKHAVPLDERALAGLSHSAMALDLYTWLAQRLHRIPHRQPQFLTWASLKEQFGARIGRMSHFKNHFRVALSQVLAFYPAAKVEGNGKGLTLYNSFPPVKKRMVLVDNSRGAPVDNSRN